MYVFKKRGKKKNKYGMIPQNYNRSTNVAMEHNTLLAATQPYCRRQKTENQLFNSIQIQNHNLCKTQNLISGAWSNCSATPKSPVAAPSRTSPVPICSGWMFRKPLSSQPLPVFSDHRPSTQSIRLTNSHAGKWLKG